jgi:hypothetical protein
MNINNLPELEAALTTLEGSGVASCWNDYRGGECTLKYAIERYNEIPQEMRDEMESPWYQCVYGNGGYSRYFVNLKTGEVTFSAFHSYADKIKRAEALGFRLH